MVSHTTVLGLALCVFLSKCDNEINFLSDEFINFINTNQSSWRAGRNFPKDTPLEYIRTIMGTLKNNVMLSDNLDIISYELDPNIKVPNTFDARSEWPNCTSLHDIRDQGTCGSCWAVAPASSMTDRICINSNRHFYFSDTDVLTCCGEKCGYGCNGGILTEAWKYYRLTGIVSGGPYNSKQGCRPYEVAPCIHNSNKDRPECGRKVETPHCVTKCESSYSVNYLEDKQKGSNIYKLGTLKAAQVNLLKYGPITSSFTVYSDFINYKEGVYKHVGGKSEGDHSVKIIGWGKQNGENYWLVANSWNTDWGDKGFFKILRGVNHCGIEENMVAGQ